MSESEPPIAPPGSHVPLAKAPTDAGPTASASDARPPHVSPHTPPPGDAGARPSRFRRLLAGVVVLVVLVAIGIVVVVLLNRGDGTKRTANPLEVRRLVATFACAPNNPSTPENLRLTAGQEVVKVPRAGCAVVGEVLGQVDRLQKVQTKTSSGGDCTVTLDAPKEYGRTVDAASNVSDGQVRALVAGGYLLDVRAVIDYPGRPSAPLHVVFTAPDPAACTAVSAGLALQ